VGLEREHNDVLEAGERVLAACESLGESAAGGHANAPAASSASARSIKSSESPDGAKRGRVSGQQWGRTSLREEIRSP
jgi:hypothetical protein